MNLDQHDSEGEDGFLEVHHDGTTSPLRSVLAAAPPALQRLQGQQSSRENTPVRPSYESIFQRPRSNPRSRTPMRYESPLDPEAFRRTAVISETDEDAPREISPRRITIRPLAGTAVGTTPVNRAERPSKSQKQGPSQRKVRRWRNEDFCLLASDVASSGGSRGRATAQVLLKAQKDAHLYRDVYNPEDHRSKTLSRFLKDETICEQFFHGDAALPKPTYPRRIKEAPATTPEAMMHRIDRRLVSLVTRACAESCPAFTVVKALEGFLVRVLADKHIRRHYLEHFLQDPVVAQDDSSTRIQCFFDATSSTGGFHRLLLHALSQFHGFQCNSSTIAEGEDHPAARVLTATRLEPPRKPKFRLVDHLVNQRHNDK